MKKLLRNEKEHTSDSRLYRNGSLAKAKVSYEMRPNPTFAVQTYKTYDEALEALNNFNNQEPDSEYFDYWEDQKNQCVIVRVQQVEDVVRTSEDSRYEQNGNVSSAKQRLEDYAWLQQRLQNAEETTEEREVREYDEDCQKGVLF